MPVFSKKGMCWQPGKGYVLQKKINTGNDAEIWRYITESENKCTNNDLSFNTLAEQYKTRAESWTFINQKKNAANLNNENAGEYKQKGKGTWYNPTDMGMTKFLGFREVGREFGCTGKLSEDSYLGNTVSDVTADNAEKYLKRINECTYTNDELVKLSAALNNRISRESNKKIRGKLEEILDKVSQIGRAHV